MSADLLELAASLLGDLTGELVFVGGASIHLWLSDPAAPPVRSTDDVDAICDVLGRPAYYRLGERLRQHGFTEAIGDPVICRWRHADSGLTLDVMPTDEAILGFSNPWYPLALATAVERRLPSGTLIRAASPPLILATKLAAWEGRGNGDLLRSLDVHDIIVLADGRPELADELASQLDDLRVRLRQPGRAPRPPVLRRPRRERSPRPRQARGRAGQGDAPTTRRNGVTERVKSRRLASLKRAIRDNAVTTNVLSSQSNASAKPRKLRRSGRRWTHLHPLDRFRSVWR